MAGAAIAMKPESLVAMSENTTYGTTSHTATARCITLAPGLDAMNRNHATGRYTSSPKKRGIASR